MFRYRSIILHCQRFLMDYTDFSAPGALAREIAALQLETESESLDMEARRRAHERLVALQKGQLPTNEQIVQGLDTVLHDPQWHARTQQMSSSGRQIMEDTQRLLQDTKDILLTKNKDEHLQQALFHAMRAQRIMPEGEIPAFRPYLGSKIDQNQLMEEFKQGGDSLLTVTRLLVSSEEFRGHFYELLQVLQHIFKVRLQAVVKQGAKQLEAMVPESVKPEVQKISESVQQLAEGEVPVSETVEKTVQHGAEAVQEMAPEMGQKASKAAEKGKQMLQKTEAASSESWAQLDIPENVPKQSKKQPSGSNISYYKRQKPQQTMEKEEIMNLSDEDKKELVDKLEQVLIQLEQKPEYQQAIRTLTKAWQHLYDQVWQLEQKLEQTVKKEQIQQQRIVEQRQLHLATTMSEKHEHHPIAVTQVEPVSLASTTYDQEMRLAAQHAKALIESWAHDYKMDHLLNSMRVMMKKLATDRELTNWFEQLSQFTQRVLYEPGYVARDKEAFEKEANQLLFHPARHTLLDKYRHDVDQFQQELTLLTDAVRQDTFVQNLSSDVQRLWQDLVLDKSKTRPEFKPELLGDLQKVLPLILEQIRYVPLNRMDVSNDDYDITLDDIVVSTHHILPRNVRLDTTMAYNDEGDTVNRVVLHIGQIGADVKNMRYEYTKKESGSVLLPSHDRGLADIRIYGEGMSLDVVVRPHLPGLMASSSLPVAGKALGEKEFVSQELVYESPEHEKRDVLAAKLDTQTQNVEQLESKPTGGIGHSQGHTGFTFTIDCVRCQIHKMSLRLHNTEHDVINTILQPFIKRRVLESIEQAVEDSVAEMLLEADKKAQSATGAAQPEQIIVGGEARVMPEWASTSFDPVK